MKKCNKKFILRIGYRDKKMEKVQVYVTCEMFPTVHFLDGEKVQIMCALAAIFSANGKDEKDT